MRNDIEDTTRYTAPPDGEPEERRYYEYQILDYVKSWIPGYPTDTYTIEQVRDILKYASEGIKSEDHGIDTI